jgi:hypothetical protein
MRKHRTRFTPSAVFLRRCDLYFLAAGTASVASLGFATPANAEIIYTPTSQMISRNTGNNLDLNHDGITDFLIFDQVFRGGIHHQSSNQGLFVRAASSNAVKCAEVACLSTLINAVALHSGDQIGPEHRPYGWLPQQAEIRRGLRRGKFCIWFVEQCSEPISRPEIQDQWRDSLRLGAP